MTTDRQAPLTSAAALRADQIEFIAREFHWVYEKQAKAFGWTTQDSTQVEWKDLPEENRGLMLSVVATLLNHSIIALGEKAMWTHHSGRDGSGGA